MKGRVFATVREAIHAAAYCDPAKLKHLAAELDWSPSELSMRITLASESARPFPTDDLHLIRLMQITGDHSPLVTIADKMGYDVVPKRERMAEMVSTLNDDVKQLGSRVQQLVLELGELHPGSRKR